MKKIFIILLTVFLPLFLAAQIPTKPGIIVPNFKKKYFAGLNEVTDELTKTADNGFVAVPETENHWEYMLTAIFVSIAFFTFLSAFRGVDSFFDYFGTALIVLAFIILILLWG